MCANPADTLLPARFADWFAARGWTPRAHQLDLLRSAKACEDVLLIAPTGAGKTLAGFLPSLVDLDRRNAPPGLHTLYISPLKALATDVARNLEIADRRDAASRSASRPAPATHRPANASASAATRREILLTTPEQLALLLASADARHLFADLQRVVIDELHAIVTSKRGDLLSLGLARLRRLAPRMKATGLSATVRNPDDLRRLACQSPAARRRS